MQVRVLLTASARKRATQTGETHRLEALDFAHKLRIGDRVSLDSVNPLDDYAVIRRRFIAEPGGSILEVVLDHPARG